MLTVTPTIALDENELQETFIRASGPGGQNVNKVATAVQLRFDIQHSPTLPEAVRARLLRQLASRLSAEGVLTIEAKRYRTQEQNRQDARQRLIALIQQSVQPPKPRRPTRPSRAAKAKRVDTKKQRGNIKKLRGNPSGD